MVDIQYYFAGKNLKNKLDCIWFKKYFFTPSSEISKAIHFLFISSLALQLPLGRTTVMHLIPRESLPEPNSQGIFISLRFSFFCMQKKFLINIFLVHILYFNCFLAHDFLFLSKSTIPYLVQDLLQIYLKNVIFKFMHVIFITFVI